MENDGSMSTHPTDSRGADDDDGIPIGQVIVNTTIPPTTPAIEAFVKENNIPADIMDASKLPRVGFACSKAVSFQINIV